MYPKITFGGQEESGVIYEGATAYRPKASGGFNVYFYTDSGYWRYINDCSSEDFKKHIKPRIIKLYGG